MMHRLPSRWLIPLCFAALLATQSGCGTTRKLQQPPQAIDPAALVQTARSQLGVCYQAGGSTPRSGFDCSGFAQWVFWQHGLALPRQSFDQYQVGEKVARRKLRTGDLVFFEIEKKGASHVGIYVDRGVFIHCSSTGGCVRQDYLGDIYWLDHYLGARRVFP